MSKSTTGQRLFIVALLVSVIFLSVVFGMVAHKFKLWPYSLFRDAYRAAKAWEERIAPRTREMAGFFVKARYPNSGLLQYNKEEAYNGFTLFTSGHAQKAFLLSMDGQIVHEWHFPFSSAWTNPPHIEFPVSEEFIYCSHAYLYPNGDLLAIYLGMGDSPWGYGLVKVDKDSKMIWKYAENVHHDVDVDSDGKIYTLIHEFTTEKIPEVALDPPFLEDSIVVLSADGQELKRVSISKAFRNSDYSSVLKVLVDAEKKGDPWHTNNVELLNEQMAAQFPFLKKGQVLVSLRNIDTIAVVDLDKEQVVWAITGPWHRQHDPDFLSNGNMILFDNRGHYGKGGSSRVIEFNPTTMEILWQYTGDEKNIFASWISASQQRLPNGNTLITESNGARLFEVTREKQIVWEFINPFRARDNQWVAIFRWGQRFHPDSLNFEFNLKK
ncbi:MAG: hypothetical protein DRR08_30245 [Candidatus Parabeggiatoa sp. nov. 2]|nr:MAG: hypothetical protein DRR08_30245 [Gammaproteobacteria bacterium]